MWVGQPQSVRAADDALVDGLDPDDSPTLGDRGDGSYGRFEGDLSLSLGAGVQLDAELGELLVAGHLATRVYQSAGFYAGFAQGLEGATLTRTGSLGIVVEPLFLLRWPNDREWGRPFWDLTFDSLSVSVGAHLDEPRGGDFGDWAGLEAGLGFGVPLVARAPGPWLRARGLLLTRQGGVAGAALIHLEWQWLFFTGILDDGY